MNQQRIEQIWLTQRVQGLLPGYTLQIKTDTFGRTGEWEWVAIFSPSGWYCGGFGFDEVWIRVDSPEQARMGGLCFIPCPTHLRQETRAAVNQAIAELSAQQIAA